MKISTLISTFNVVDPLSPRFRSARRAVWRLAATFPFVVSTAAHAGYNVTDVIDPTGTNFINLLGINNSGTIAGFDNGATNAGFTLMLPNVFTVVNYPNSPTLTVQSTQVTGINASGDLSGIYVNSGGNTHGFTRIGGTFTTVDDIPSGLTAPVFNQALGINNSHETVGYYAPTEAGAPGQVAYSQKDGVFTVISGLPSNVNSQAVGINSAGDIVGFYQPTAATSLGFLDVGGTITTIDPFGVPADEANTQALGINDLGEIVGFWTDPATGIQHGYIDNNGAFTSFDPTGSVTTTINGLNNHGVIVGFFTDANDNVVGFVGSPVPEPSTWAAMLIGFAGLAAAGLRVRRAATAA